jgi:translocation protein SEC63
LLIFSHPDKVQLADNQTKEEAESKYVELTKAYKALTDEVTRENLAKYGNPDGPQQREDKIAIPQWVVEGKNSIWVLGAYGLVLGVGIPWVVVSRLPKLDWNVCLRARAAGGSHNDG